jgi:hypothetical protein
MQGMNQETTLQSEVVYSRGVGYNGVIGLIFNSMAFKDCQELEEMMQLAQILMTSMRKFTAQRCLLAPPSSHNNPFIRNGIHASPSQLIDSIDATSTTLSRLASLSRCLTASPLVTMKRRRSTPIGQRG